MSSLNKTGLASKINFLRAIQSELWKGEIYQGKPEVVDTGNWAQTQQVVCFFKIMILMVLLCLYDKLAQILLGSEQSINNK